MYVLTILPFTSKTRTDRLTYFSMREVTAGMVVEAPFRSSTIRGLVIEANEVLKEKANIKLRSYELRKIKSIKGYLATAPGFFEHVESLRQMYFSSESTIIDALLPALYLDSKAAYVDVPSKIEHAHMPDIRSLQAAKSERIARYKMLARESFAKKESLFIVVPNEHEGQILEEELKRGIDEYVILCKSVLGKKAAEKFFSKILTEEHPLVIIGTAPFLSLPIPKLGLIIVEHESSRSYRTISHPHIDLKLYAKNAAQSRGIPIILGDTILSFETLYLKEELMCQDIITPTYKLENLPIFSILKRDKDMLKESKVFSPLIANTKEEISTALVKHKKVFCFALRSGYAMVTVCNTCGETLSCEECGQPLVLHESTDKRLYVCHRCKLHRPSAATCSHCGSWNLTALGVGIDRAHEELVSLFGKERVIRFDKTTITKEEDALRIVQQFLDPSSDKILLGTELSLHYLPEKSVDLSCVVSFDSLFNIPHYGIYERMLHLILLLSEATKETLIIQTKHTDDPLIDAFKKNILISWIRNELTERKMLNYPPYSTLIKLTQIATESNADERLSELKTLLAQYTPDIFKTLLSRKEERVKLQGLIRHPALESRSVREREALAHVLTLAQNLGWEIEVNPETLI